MCIFILFLIVGQVLGARNDLSEFTISSTRFTLDFFRLAYNQAPNENSVLSPISIQSSLSMLAHVASSNAAKEMQHVLGLPTSQVQSTRNLQEFLNSSNNEALHIVSKVYHADGELNADLLPPLRDSYGTEVESVDFSQPEQVSISVNEWVERVTNGMITNFLNPNDLSADDNLMLLNAVTLNASWQLKFTSELTEKKVFHHLNGDHEIDMMSEDDDFRYGEVKDLRVLELPYEEHTDLSMLLILPKTGTTLKQTIDQLDADCYATIEGALTKENVLMKIPKFSIRRNTQAKDILQLMGLRSIFEAGAFKIFANDDSRLTELRQSAVIDVTEDGTSAAAVTEMRFQFLSAPSQTIVFTVDQPFIYIIRKNSSKDIIFIGHYSHYQQR